MADDVVIFAEHLSRDLESAVLLKVELARRGVSSRVVVFNWGEAPAMLSCRPKVIVAPWCNDTAFSNVFDYFRGGHADGTFDVVNLCAEQLSSDDARDFLVRSARTRDVWNVAWGDGFRDALVRGGVDPTHVLVAGSNRLDFFSPRLRPFSASKDELATEHGLRPDVPWVLLIGNFSACFCAADSLERIASCGYAHIAEFADLSCRALGTLLEWMETLLRDPATQGIDFIYRPHPSEHVTEDLRLLEERFANLHVIGDRAIRDWLLNTDLALEWLSTSAVEAAFAGVPVFALDLVSVPEHLQVDLVGHLPCIASAAELVSLVTAGDYSALAGEDRSFVEKIGRYYHQPSSSACEETADLVERLLGERTGSFSCRTSTPRRALKLVKWAAREVLWRLGILQHVRRFRVTCKNHPRKSSIAELEAALDAIW